jgi:hypothetical protein
MNDENLPERTIDKLPASSTDAAPENDSSLEALVREEQSLVRERLREELGREPSQKEADEWLSEQTEGY